jgi:hypothetical protein
MKKVQRCFRGTLTVARKTYWNQCIALLSYFLSMGARARALESLNIEQIGLFNFRVPIKIPGNYYVVKAIVSYPL